MTSTGRSLILVIGGLYLAGFVAVTALWWPNETAWAIWGVSPLFALTWLLTLWLLPKKILWSQVAWQVGLSVLITVSIYVFRVPEIAFAYALLPLMAVVTVGWLAGVIVEGGIVVLTLWLWRTPVGPLIPAGYAPAIILGGAITLALGWSATRSLFTVIHWTLFGLRRAEENLEETRQHRAQLYQIKKDLEQAYYRLGRTNAALVGAWKAAEDAERLKTEFVTKVSHELRTPLNLIIGFSEMMATAPESYGVPLPGPYRSDMNALHYSAQHLLALVDDVLDLARIEIGKISLVREESEIVPLVAEATNMLHDYVTAKGLELRVSIAHDLPRLWLDRLRVRQVLLNLLVNAARFTEHGSISVDVTRQGDEVLVRVTDTGRGIPAADFPRIFEEFHTTAQARSTWHSGSGLGLPISRKFIELHRGHMGVESAENQGTSFWFTLPCLLPSGANELPTTLDRPRPIAQLGDIQHTIVVAHDDPGSLTLLRRYLESYQVVGASTLPVAIALAEQHKAIAIVTGEEVQVPQVAPADLLVIQCPLPNSKQMAADLGAHELLVKPVSADALQTAMERLGRPPRKVLIADDDPDIVRLFRRMLQPHVDSRSGGSAQFLEAYTGEEALGVMRAERPDLVFLDAMMPDVNGYEVLAQVAADPVLAGTPMILVSAHAQDYASLRLPGSIQVARRAGFETGEIVEALEALLRALVPAGYHLGATEPTHAAASAG
jgi:signal transduction histidine kinase